uniref:Uncharacterized protein n=1 Tax=Sander lucioperca TaxID=283035 RepID=A0A8C9XCP3_SANLU
MTKTIGYRDWRWQALWWHHFFLLWKELKQGSVVGNLLRVASEAGEQYFSVDAGKATTDCIRRGKPGYVWYLTDNNHSA